MLSDAEAYPIVKDIATRLAARRLVLRVEESDGRLNSIANEHDVLEVVPDILEDLRRDRVFPFEIEFVGKTGDRNWFDFALRLSDGTSSYLAPVNIKVSSFRSADNLGCKAGILYALSGIEAYVSGLVSWESFFEFLHLHKGARRDADYYFLAVEKGKKAAGRVVGTSLRRLRKVVCNGNNLPFQACWNDNARPPDDQMPIEDAENFLVDFALRGSFERAAAPKSILERYYGQGRAA